MKHDTVLEFPCAFPVKIFGRNDQAFRDKAWSIVTAHYKDLEPDQVTENVSRNGKFVSMTFTVEAQDQNSLDTLYGVLTESLQVLMAL